MPIQQDCQNAWRQCSIEASLIFAPDQQAGRPRNGTVWRILAAATVPPSAADRVDPTVPQLRRFARIIRLIQEAGDQGRFLQQASNNHARVSGIPDALDSLEEAQQLLRRLWFETGASSPTSEAGAWYSKIMFVNALLQVLPQQYEPPRGRPRFRLQFCSLCQRWVHAAADAAAFGDFVTLADSHLIPRHAYRRQPEIMEALDNNAYRANCRLAISEATGQAINIDRGYAKLFCKPDCEVTRFQFGENYGRNLFNAATKASLQSEPQSIDSQKAYHYAASITLRAALSTLPMSGIEELLFVLQLSRWLLSFRRDAPAAAPAPMPLYVLVPKPIGVQAWENELTHFNLGTATIDCAEGNQAKAAVMVVAVLGPLQLVAPVQLSAAARQSLQQHATLVHATATLLPQRWWEVSGWPGCHNINFDGDMSLSRVPVSSLPFTYQQFLQAKVAEAEQHYRNDPAHRQCVDRTRAYLRKFRELLAEAMPWWDPAVAAASDAGVLLA